MTNLTNQQKLEKLIEKAIGGEYRLPIGASLFAVSDNIVQLFDEDQEYLGSTHAYVIIFNHDFAKAFFGDDVIPNEYFATAFIPEETKYFTTRPAWQAHLQQMVIADDPISYMYEQVFSNK